MRFWAFAITGFVFLFPFLIFADTPSVMEVGKFSTSDPSQPLPPEWKPLYFKKIERPTTYSLVRENNSVVIKAVAHASASGLTREIRINPKEFPIIQWRWKVENLIKGADFSRKEGDDYPARIYITFEHDPDKLGFFEKIKYEAVKLLYGRYPPHAAINYIWASKGLRGLVVPNPYTDRAMMIVVRSGEDKLNEWVEEERNLYEDFKQAFKEEPPVISGIAIMTDTDNTGESAVAFYGDIFFRKR